MMMIIPISLNIKSGWPIGILIYNNNNNDDDYYDNDKGDDNDDDDDYFDDDGGGGGADAVLKTSVMMSFDGSRVYHENVTLPSLLFFPSLLVVVGNDSNNWPAANAIIPHRLLDESDSIYLDISYDELPPYIAVALPPLITYIIRYLLLVI